MASPVAPTGANDSAVKINSTANADCVIARPTNVVEDDLMVMILVRAVVSATITEPTGWTEEETLDHDGGNTSVWYKLAGASEPSDYTWSWTGNTLNVGAIQRVTGSDLTTLIAASTQASGTSATPDPPNADPGSSDDYLAVAFVSMEGKATFTPTTSPDVYIENVDITTTGGGSQANHSCAYIESREYTGQAENPGTVTASRTDGWAAFTLIIAPAAAGPVVPPKLVQTTGTAEVAPRPPAAQFVDGPFGLQPVPFDLVVKTTGTEPGPLQPNLTRFTRPDVVVAPPVTELPQVLHTGTEVERPTPPRTQLTRPDVVVPDPTVILIELHETGADAFQPLDPVSRLTIPGEVAPPPPPIPPELVQTTGAEGDPDRVFHSTLVDGPFGPQPVPFDLQTKTTGHDVGPEQPNEGRFTRPDVVVPPAPTPFDLVARRTGHTPRPDRVVNNKFSRPDVIVPPPPIPFDLVAKATGHTPLPPRIVNTDVVDGPFGPQPIPFDLEAKTTGHTPGPDQPNDTRFDRPDVIVIVPSQPFDLVAKRTGHTPTPGQRNESRFLDGPFGLQPVPPDLVQTTGADGPPEPIRLTAFDRGPFGDQPLPPELIHTTGTELGPTQPNDTRFSRPDEIPIIPLDPDLLGFLVNTTGADADLGKLLLSRGVFVLAAAGAPTVPPGRPKAGASLGRASVLDPSTVSDSSVTGAPDLTRPGPSLGKTKVGP